MQMWSAEAHDIFEVRVAKKPKGYQREGCAVLALKGMSRIVKSVLTPTHEDLERRGIAVRFSGGLSTQWLCPCTVPWGAGILKTE